MSSGPRSTRSLMTTFVPDCRARKHSVLQRSNLVRSKASKTVFEMRVRAPHSTYSVSTSGTRRGCCDVARCSQRWRRCPSPSALPRRRRSSPSETVCSSVRLPACKIRTPSSTSFARRRACRWETSRPRTPISSTCSGAPPRFRASSRTSWSHGQSRSGRLTAQRSRLRISCRPTTSPF